MRSKQYALLILLVISLSIGMLPILPASAEPDAQALVTPISPDLFPTPSGPISYTLKNWTEEDAAQTLSQIENAYLSSYADLISWKQQQVFDQHDYWQAFMLSLDENLVRFPKSASRDSWLAKLAVERGNRWPSTGSTDPFRELLQITLNLGQVQPADLGDWLSGLSKDLAVRVIDAPNLFGDDQLNKLVAISNQNYSHSIWVIRSSQASKFQVFSLYPDWFYGPFDPEKINVQNLNGGLFNDIVVPLSWETDLDGIPGCAQSLDVFEWDRYQFVNIAANIDDVGVELKAANTCLGFKFIPGQKNTQSILSSIQNGPIIRNILYEWNGKVYQLSGEEVQVLPSQDSPDWAFAVGPTNDEALSMLENWVQQWPASYDTEWGPAAQDFFKMRLGIWYAFRGQIDNAISTLEAVRDQPSNPNFKIASQWADLFLRGYRSRARLYQGCGLLLERFFQDRQILLNANEYVEPNELETAMLSTWGYTQSGWGRVNTDHPPRLTGQTDPFNLCSQEIAFSTTIAKADIQTTRDLINWLTLQHIQWTGLKEGDVDGDGQDDWLLLTTSGPTGNLQLWSLFRENNQVTASVAANFESRAKDLPTTWFHILPDYKAPVLNLYQAGDEITIFRAIKNRQQVGFEHPVEGTVSQRYDWNKVNVVVLVEKALYEILTVREINGDQQTLTWDSKTHQVKPSGPSMDTRIDQVESLLFDPTEQDFTLAADHAAQLLAKGIHEDEAYRLGYGPPHIRPRVMYLLALAYELGGQDDKAMLAYWKLWNNYPASPYALLAKAKLQPVIWN